MRKKLHIFTLIVALLTTFSAMAKPVDSTLARKIGVTFLRGVGCTEADQIRNRSAELPFTHFYLFAADKGGFVMVAGDDCVIPILAYSSTSAVSTKDIPEHIASWLTGYEKQIEANARLSEESDPDIAQQWDLLQKGQMPKAKSDTCVEPLMTTKWNQTPYYDLMCPADPNSSSGHAVAGCTAIATAQVMKYWNHPQQGYGSHTYNHGTYGTLSADFGNTTYKWDKMTNKIGESSTQAQINAVATLIYHVGVATEMNYSPEGSGAYTIGYSRSQRPSSENALKNYFKYKGSMYPIFRSACPHDVYDSILYDELNHGRPIIYTGTDGISGHAFVLDGYDNYGAFHVNWGWGGKLNAYFAMGALNPNLEMNFNSDNCALVGIEPDYDFDTTRTTSVSVTSDNESYGTVTGGGTYAFGDEVTLQATAPSGYRFVRWNDYCPYNSRQFIATGGNYDLTAYFEPLEGDTLDYVPSDTWAYDFGRRDTLNECGWGIRLPASVLTPGHSLKSMMTKFIALGDYRVAVYFDTLDSAVVEKRFTIGDNDLYYWKEIELDTPLPISGDKDLYIFLYNRGGGNPIALSFDVGNDDCMLLRGFGSIRPDKKYSVMIRGIFALDSNEYTITATPNDSTKGSVTGGGTYPAGTEVTLTAIAHEGYYFNGWNDGTAENPRTLHVTEDLTLVAKFSTDPNAINGAQQDAVELYPNPTTGKIRIEAPDMVTVTVFDPMGRRVGHYEHCSEIDLSEHAPAIYTLRIITAQGIVVKKVVKGESPE